MFHPVDGISGGKRFEPDHAWGLRIDVYRTLGVHIPSLIESLGWPREIRGEHADLYRSIPQGQETVFSPWDTDIAALRSHSSSDFVRYIDIVTIVNTHQWLQLTYPPFQYRSFAVDMLREVVSFGLGFVSGLGTLLAVSFNVGYVLITTPDQFRDEFVPSLGFEFVAGLIEAAIHFRRRSILPNPKQAWTFKHGWEFEDRMPPLTSPKHAAGPPSDTAPPGHVDDSTAQAADSASEREFKDRMPPLTSPKHAAGPPSDDVPPGHIDDSIMQVAEDPTGQVADDIDGSKRAI